MGLKTSFFMKWMVECFQALRLVLDQGVANHVLWEIFTSWLFSWQPLKVGIGGTSADYKWISSFRSRWQGSDFKALVFFLHQGFGNCSLTHQKKKKKRLWELSPMGISQYLIEDVSLAIIRLASLSNLGSWRWLTWCQDYTISLLWWGLRIWGMVFLLTIFRGGLFN